MRPPLPTWSQATAKVAILLLMVFFFGRWITGDAVASRERAATLTMETYVAEFETYKASLTADTSTSFAFNLGVAWFLVAGVFLAYELLAQGIAFVLERAARGPVTFAEDAETPSASSHAGAAATME